jgi:TetR/AcrR family transcriptional regulator, fatty acid metabolism regulator protein
LNSPQQPDDAAVAVTQERARDRQRRILDAALDVFTRRGFREASVDEIAAAAQTSKGGVYFHFPGKQRIFRALLDFSTRRLLERVEEAIGRESEPVAKADAALLTVLRAFGEHRALARLFMIEALGAGSELQRSLLAVHDEFIALIQRHLDAAVAAGVIEPVDTRLASRAWFGALNEVILHWLLTEEPESLEDTYGGLRPLLMRSVGVGDGQTGRLANWQGEDEHDETAGRDGALGNGSS